MNTHGWDTVSVVADTEVNAALDAHKNELHMEFAADPGTDPPVLAKGRYRSWQVVAGGSEKWMYLSLAIAEGTLSIGRGTRSPLIPDDFSPRVMASKDFDLAGLSVIVAVNLLLVPMAGAVKAMTFDIRKAGHELPPPEEGYVVPVRVIDPEKRLDIASSSLLAFALADDLARNGSRVTYVLGTISPIPPGQDEWLSPTASKFCFVARNDGSISVAVLNMTQGRPPTGLPLLVDPGALLAGLTSSYVIAGRRVLQNIILPVLPEAYKTQAASFRFDDQQNKIVNTKSFKTFSVKSGAITYYPEITEFSMRIEGHRLLSSVRGRCDMGIGITMSFFVGAQNEARFDPSTQQLTFLADNNPMSDSSAKIPWYLAFAGPIVIGITAICVSIISKDIASSLNKLLRTALTFIKDPPQPVKFTGTSKFVVQYAGLNDSLYMMGRLQ